VSAPVTATAQPPSEHCTKDKASYRGLKELVFKACKSKATIGAYVSTKVSKVIQKLNIKSTFLRNVLEKIN
jgi:hypothetical protein